VEQSWTSTTERTCRRSDECRALDTRLNSTCLSDVSNSVVEGSQPSSEVSRHVFISRQYLTLSSTEAIIVPHRII